MQATVFRALGEPSRLEIVHLLRDGPRSVGEIATALQIRQPQVSKHLRVLRETGIVRDEAVARHRVYALESDAFDAIDRWLRSFEYLWLLRLDQLGDHLEQMQDPHERNNDDRP